VSSNECQLPFKCITVWPLLDLPSPDAVAVPNSVTVPFGQTSETLSISMYPVNYPLVATITGRSCTSKQSATTLTVTPVTIPAFGPAADVRVMAILNQFLALRSYEQALDDVIALRNSKRSNGIGQDTRLAAADHYLFSLTGSLLTLN